MAVAVVRGGHGELQDAGETPALQKVGSERVGFRGPRRRAKHLLPKRERERERVKEVLMQTREWGGGGGGGGK